MLTVLRWYSAVIHLFVFIKYCFLKSFSGDPIKTHLGWKTWQRSSQPRADLFLQACLKNQECWQGWIVNMSCTSCSVGFFGCLAWTEQVSKWDARDWGLWQSCGDGLKSDEWSCCHPWPSALLFVCASQNGNIWSVHESAFIKQVLVWNIKVSWTGAGLL